MIKTLIANACHPNIQSSNSNSGREIYHPHSWYTLVDHSMIGKFSIADIKNSRAND